MRVFLPAILGLAACAVAGDPKSYSQWVDELPQCAQSCYSDVYDNVFAGPCGKDAKTSTASKDVQCICSSKGKMADIQDDSSDLGSCLLASCMDADDDSSDELLDLVDDFIDMCASSHDGMPRLPNVVSQR